jgi:hypothetical protein
MQISNFFQTLNMKTLMVAYVGALSMPAMAHDGYGIDGSSVIGGAIGGGAGAAVGSAVGGRNGAILGSAVGAAAGVAIATPQPIYRTEYRYRNNYHDDDDRGWHRGHYKHYKN